MLHDGVLSLSLKCIYQALDITLIKVYNSSMNKLIIIALVLLVPVFIWIVRDYQRRMVTVNANYMCNVAGNLEYCELLNK